MSGKSLGWLRWHWPLLWLLAVGVSPLYGQATLAGVWQHQRDSGGWKVNAGGSVTLTLYVDGQASLTAEAPNQNPLTETGTWSVEGGRVTIKIAGELNIDNKPYQLQGYILTLPEQLSTENPGTSTWSEAANTGLPAIYQAFDASVESTGDGAGAAQKAAQQAQQEGVGQVEVVYGGEALEITGKTTAPGGEKPKVWILFRTKPGQSLNTKAKPNPRPLIPFPLNANPNTYLNAKNPGGDPDAPKSREALVVVPFLSKSYMWFPSETWDGPSAARPAKVVPNGASFKSAGDDPLQIVEQLKNAGYKDPKVLLDDAATPVAIYNALQSRPSVIYFDSHGAPGLIGAAGSLLFGPRGSTPDEMVNGMRAQQKSQGLPDAVARTLMGACVQGSPGNGFCFPALTPEFFQAALGQQGMPDGFVYLNACKTFENDRFANAFHAKAFVAYKGESNAWASPIIARYIFTNMAHPGHSVREAWDRAQKLAYDAQKVWRPDDDIVSKNVDLQKDAGRMVVWGDDLKSYDFPISTPVFWLTILARNSVDNVNDGVAWLKSCLDDHWGAGPGQNGLNFCRKAILGTHLPDAAEVNEASNLVEGKPKWPHGRFVLR